MTYTLGTRSRRNLAQVHPWLVAIVERAITITTQDFTVVQGIRTIDEQRTNVAKGVSQTLNSKHLPQADGLAHAVDLVPYIGGSARPDAPDAAYYAVAEAMRRAALDLDAGGKVVWGGCWDRTLAGTVGATMEAARAGYRARRAAAGKSAFWDGGHFELRGA